MSQGEASAAYDHLTSLYPFGFIDAQSNLVGPITYSIVTSVMREILEDNNNSSLSLATPDGPSGACCVGGRIELFFQPPFNDPHPTLLWDKLFTEWFLPIHWQNRFRYIYLPLTASWLRQPESEFHIAPDAEQAQHKSRLDPVGQQAQPHYVCNGQCANSHCMAVLLDAQEETIEYFDPDGESSPWYSTIRHFVKLYVHNHPLFVDYQMVDFVPIDRMGVASLVHEPLCVLFSTLYVYCRTHVSRQKLLTKWHSYTNKQWLNRLHHWQNVLSEFARPTLLVEAEIVPLFKQAWNDCIKKKHSRPGGAESTASASAWQQMQNITQLLFYNIPLSVQLLQNF